MRSNTSPVLNERLTEDQIIGALGFLHSLGYPLNSRAMQLNRNDSQVNSLLSEHLGLPVTPGKVFDHAYALNPFSWKWWLRRAGLDVESMQVRTHRIKHLTVDEARMAVAVMVRQGVSVFASDILENSEPHSALQTLFHREVAPKEIYLDVVRYHGISWTTFLRDVGLPEYLVRKEFDRTEHLSPTQIVQALRYLESLGYSLNANTYQNQSREIQLPAGITSQPVTLAKIYREATRYHQTPWDWWKQRASKKSRSLIFVSVRQIIQVIRFLDAVNSSLVLRNIERDHGDEVINARILEITGFPLTPAKVYDQAHRVHGRHWEIWLKQAGIVFQTGVRPSESRGPRPLSTQERQELHSNYEAMMPGGVGFEYSPDGVATAVAIDNRTGETEILASEYSEKLHNLEVFMSPRELFIFYGILDFLADGFSLDMAELQQYFLTQKSERVGIDEIQALFQLIINNPELKSLFHDDE